MKTLLLPSCALLLAYIYLVHAGGEPLKSQSLIPFPRVGRSRTMLGGSSSGHSGLFFSPPGTLRGPNFLNELREYKRHLIPFPRVGKRQTLIPFPRVGRSFVRDDDEEDYSPPGAVAMDFPNNAASSRWTASQESSEEN